uniref:ascorbate ferrireductase (transmembrane) n=1 Tax=Anopheles funestus TaxID=62324 RepID=A0A182RWP7_ANOFN
MKQLLIEEGTINDSTSGSRLKPIASKVVLNVIYPICIIFPTVSIIIACWRNGLNNFYTWHVLLTGIGVSGHAVAVAIKLFANRISLLCGQQFYRHSSCTSSRRTIHWILQSGASACVLAGTVLQYINREMKHKHHIVSVHSIVGLLSLVLVVVGLVSGVVALFGWELRKYLRPLWLYRTHRSIGVVAFLAGILALVIAYDKQIFKDNFCSEIRLVLKVATIIAALITAFGTFKKLYNLVCELCTVR